MYIPWHIGVPGIHWVISFDMGYSMNTLYQAETDRRGRPAAIPPTKWYVNTLTTASSAATHSDRPLVNGIHLFSVYLGGWHIIASFAVYSYDEPHQRETTPCAVQSIQRPTDRDRAVRRKNCAQGNVSIWRHPLTFSLW